MPDGNGAATAAGSVHVVVLPADVDISNAERVSGDLDAALSFGVTVVIADMSRTTFCDTSGARSLVLFNRRAAECGAELRLALRSEEMLRVFGVLGIDQVLQVYPALNEALQYA